MLRFCLWYCWNICQIQLFGESPICVPPPKFSWVILCFIWLWDVVCLPTFLQASINLCVTFLNKSKSKVSGTSSILDKLKIVNIAYWACKLYSVLFNRKQKMIWLLVCIFCGIQCLGNFGFSNLSSYFSLDGTWFQ